MSPDPASPPHKPALSRRAFLGLAWKGLLALGGAVGLGGLLRFLAHQPNPEVPTQFDLGMPDRFAPGSHTVIPEAQAVLIRSGSSLAAYSIICPHLGCQAEQDGEGFSCPCHGSKFNQRGEILRGPAERSLRPLRLEIASNGHLILHTKDQG